MAKTFIFAIGGTGARVLRSLTMLMASGVKGMTEDICPIIIDYDLNNGDKDRAITCMKKYSEIQKLVVQGKNKIDSKIISDYEKNHNGYRPFFSTRIDCLNGMENWSWQFSLKKGKENLKYSDYINYDKIELNSPTSQDLINCLYDTNSDSVYTELGLNMKEGFQGNPNIGSVVFNDLKGCPEFLLFSNSFRQGDRIVVIGSIFGGTGSSGIPKIVSAIRNHTRVDIQNANLSVVLVLPYFAVNTPNDREISIKSNIFNSKTKAALNYYERSGLNDQINSIYYVGDKVQAKVEPHLGNEEQKNKAHIVELISAMAVAHFITSAPQNNAKFKFNAANDIVDGIGINELIGNSNSWAQNEFVRSILHNMINFMLSVRYYLENIVCSQQRMSQRQFYNELNLNFDDKKAKSSDDAKIPIQDYCAALYDFICKKSHIVDKDDGFWPWIEELHDQRAHGSHCLKIFNLDKKNIVDFLSELNFRSSPKKISFLVTEIKISSAEPLMVYENEFDSSLNNSLAPYRKGQKQLQEEVKEAYPYIFNDILTKMPEEIRRFNATLEETFKLVP